MLERKLISFYFTYYLSIHLIRLHIKFIKSELLKAQHTFPLNESGREGADLNITTNGSKELIETLRNKVTL